MSTGFTRIAETAGIAADSSLPVEVAGKQLLVVHSQDRFFVIANQCSHAYEALDCGRVRRGWIGCPVHGARFDLATGDPMNPPATIPITTYPARVTDGWVEAELGDQG